MDNHGDEQRGGIRLMGNNEFQGTRSDRLEHFLRRGIQCDANDRTCINKAVERFTLERLDTSGTVLGVEERQVCGRHRLQFLGHALWRLIDRKPVRAPRPNGQGQHRSVA